MGFDAGLFGRLGQVAGGAANGDNHVDAFFGGVGAHFGVHLFGPDAQFEHFAEDGDFALTGHGGERVEHGFGRFGVAVVAVVQDGDAVVGEAFAAHFAALERAGGFGHCAERNTENRSYSDGCRYIPDAMFSGELDFEGRAVNAEGGAGGGDLHVFGADVGALFDTVVDCSAGVDFGEGADARVVVVEDRYAFGAELFDEFALGEGDAFDAGEVFNVRGADVGDEADVGAGDIGEEADFVGVVHAHFEDGTLGVGVEAEEGEGKADVVIEIAFVAGGAGEGGDGFLGGGFAGAAGDGDEGVGDFAAGAGGELLQGGECVGDADEAEAGHLRPVAIVHEGGGGAPFGGGLQEVVAVVGIAFEGDVESAGGEGAGVDAPLADGARVVGVRRADEFGDFVDGENHFWPRAWMALIATSLSLKWIFLSPMIW